MFDPLAWLHRLAGWLLYRRIRTRVAPEQAAALGIDPALPLVYLLPVKRLSDWLVLIHEAAALGLPPAERPLRAGPLVLRRSVAFLATRRSAWIFSSGEPRGLPDRLARLVQAAWADPSLDIRMVPVSIVWGRAPQREDSFWRALFSEGWSVRGTIAQTIAIAVYGYDTRVRFGEPVSLRGLVGQARDDGLEPTEAVRRVARLLRAGFRADREAVIGPDLSHRRTMVDRILEAPPVRARINAEADARGTLVATVHTEAERYAMEIAADYSYPVVRAVRVLLRWLWTRLYDGIEVHGYERLEAIPRDRTLVYVPCHRSHVDYLLLSYVIHERGRMIPHIAAGSNLNAPGLGSILRRGGAFFLRRSFKGNRLYATVFNEYLGRLIEHGQPIEYFVEGGRSRTGRMLAPKAGILGMTVSGWLRRPARPLVFVPVYIGYERLIEGRTYLAELHGAPKRRESLWALLSSWRMLRQNHGRVHVNFGEPIELGAALDGLHPAWRQEPREPGTRPPWLATATAALGESIVTRINAAAVVTPVSLAATVLLATARQALDEVSLIADVELLARLIRALAPPPAVVEEMTGHQAISHAVRLGYVERVRHPLGDLIVARGEGAVLLTYFRNNVLHLVALPSLVANAVALNGRIARDDLRAVISAVRPFVDNELRMPWPADSFDARLAATIDLMIAESLLRADDRDIRSPPANSLAATRLELLAAIMRPTVMRLFVALLVLEQGGSARHTADELEQLCERIAQRFSILQGLDAPEFYDRALFAQLTDTLERMHRVFPDADGKLVFGEGVEDITRLARLALPADTRAALEAMVR